LRAARTWRGYLRHVCVAAFHQCGGEAAKVCIFWLKRGSSAGGAQRLFLVAKVAQCLCPAMVRGSIFGIDGECGIECAQSFLHLATVLLNPSSVTGCPAGSDGSETQNRHRDINSSATWLILQMHPGWKLLLAFVQMKKAAGVQEVSFAE
jgi:hypothetical protein